MDLCSLSMAAVSISLARRACSVAFRFAWRLSLYLSCSFCTRRSRSSSSAFVAYLRSRFASAVSRRARDPTGQSSSSRASQTTKRAEKPSETSSFKQSTAYSASWKRRSLSSRSSASARSAFARFIFSWLMTFVSSFAACSFSFMRASSFTQRVSNEAVASMFFSPTERIDATKESMSRMISVFASCTDSRTSSLQSSMRPSTLVWKMDLSFLMSSLDARLAISRDMRRNSMRMSSSCCLSRVSCWTWRSASSFMLLSMRFER
mmetsp:Transcript_26508/g.90455  ORF Transcript_26508/g.90455 Transcript_26508/m.90455 type:complete len:263 (+) Transcript_26508:1442-2230(+)